MKAWKQVALTAAVGVAGGMLVPVIVWALSDDPARPTAPPSVTTTVDPVTIRPIGETGLYLVCLPNREGGGEQVAVVGQAYTEKIAAHGKCRP